MPIIKNLTSHPTFDNEIKSIRGQGSGLTLKYFLMLAGDDNLIKPDRMLEAFFSRFIEEKKINDALIQQVCEELVQKLFKTYPHITPRLLDHQIWNYERMIQERERKKRKNV